MKIFIVVAVFALFCSCQTKTNKAGSIETEKSGASEISDKRAVSEEEGTVKVLYFHNERRCATCMAVEEGAVDVVKQLADSTITFKSCLVGDPQTAGLEKKYQVEGQTLLVIGNDKVLDLTNMAFLNALANPDTYKEELKKQIEGLR